MLFEIRDFQGSEKFKLVLLGQRRENNISLSKTKSHHASESLNGKLLLKKQLGSFLRRQTYLLENERLSRFSPDPA